MTRDPLRRAMVSVLLGAPLPFAFIGSLALPSDHHAQQADRAAFYILLSLLLFAALAFAIWTLTRQPSVSSMRR